MKHRYLFQKVAGSRARPGGVLAGYFASKEAANRYHFHSSGYVRRVKVPTDLHVDVFGERNEY